MQIAGFDFKRWAPALILVCMTCAAFLGGLHHYLSLSALIKARSDLGGVIESHFLLAILVYSAVYISVVALSLPGGLVLTLAGGLLFGWVIGGITTVFAASIGASLVFWVAKSSFGAALREKGGPFVSRLSEGFSRNAFSYMMFLRLTPVFPFFVVNLVPAILNVPFWLYFSATVLGIIPATFAFSFAAAGLDGVIAAQEAVQPGCVQSGSCAIDIGALVTPKLTIGLMFLAALSLLPAIIFYIKGKR